MKYYLIWSHKHGMWWGPNHCGYTPHIAQAGRYGFGAAADIVLDVIPPGINVAMGEIPAAHWPTFMASSNGGALEYAE